LTTHNDRGEDRVRRPACPEEPDLDDEVGDADDSVAVAALDDPELPNDDPDLPDDEPASVQTHGQLHDEED